LPDRRSKRSRGWANEEWNPIILRYSSPRPSPGASPARTAISADARPAGDRAGAAGDGERDEPTAFTMIPPDKRKQVAEHGASVGRRLVRSCSDPKVCFGPDPAGREPGDRTESRETSTMRKPSNLQHPAPLHPQPFRIFPDVIPPEDRSQGVPQAIESTAPKALRVASADVVPTRRPTDWPRGQPATVGASKGAARAPAGSSPASRQFLEFEQSGGI
jgi:hypothetical protein